MAGLIRVPVTNSSLFEDVPPACFPDLCVRFPSVAGSRIVENSFACQESKFFLRDKGILRRRQEHDVARTGLGLGSLFRFCNDRPLHPDRTVDPIDIAPLQGDQFRGAQSAPECELKKVARLAFGAFQNRRFFGIVERIDFIG